MNIAAFDFDGTILFPDGIATSTIDAIHTWQQAGHLAVAATGKSLSAAHHILHGSRLTFDYSVLCTGTVITNRHDQVLHSAFLDPAAARRIIDQLRHVDGVAVYATTLHAPDVRLSSTVAYGTQTTILQNFQDIQVDTVDNHEFIGIPIWVPDNPALQQQLSSWITDTFDVGCVINQDFIDIIPAGTSKGAGLQWLINHLGFERGEVELFTFGDSFNDLSMHAIADHSFSLPWSPAKIHAATDEVIESVDQALTRLLETSPVTTHAL